MKILVTGASGFIGTHLSRELRMAGHDVAGIDFQFGDLLKPDTIKRALSLHEPDLVVHLAAKVGRIFGEDDPAATVADNAGMTTTVAKACGEQGVRLAYASTSEIYGDLGEATAFERGRKALPHNVYGLSKRWGEEACLLYAPDGLVVFRISMPYGPGLPAGRGRAAMVNFLHQADNRREIPVHRGAERSWCWVGDTVRGMRMILETKPRNDTRDFAWNVGRDDAAVPMRVVAEMACLMTGAPTDLIREVEPPGMQTVVKRLSCDKLRRLGWEPQVGLEEGMRKTLDWLRAGQPNID